MWNVKAIGWNDILPIEKPIWFDKYQLDKEENELQWQEDLVWKDCEQVRDSLGKSIAKIAPISNDTGLIGIYIAFSDGEKLVFEDVGL